MDLTSSSNKNTQEECDQMLPPVSLPTPHVQSAHQTKCSKRSICLKIFIVQWIFTISSGIFAYFFIGDFIQGIVNKGLIIDPKSEFFYLWERPPITPEMRVYLFNVTNAEDWLSGKSSKISVDQVGPFVYKESWKKTNITFHSDHSTVSYRVLKHFEFLPEKSSDENDLIVIPNIPLFSAAASMKDANGFTLMGFKAFLNMMSEDSKQMFMTKKAKEIIWGYDDQLSSMASLVLPPEEVTVPGKFGLLLGKNATLGPWQRVNTGSQDLSLISESVAFHGRTHFKAWSTSECNRVQGSDGGFFHPWIDPKERLSIFVPDLCSPIRLTSTGEEVYYDDGRIKTIRFQPDPKTFNYDDDENHCYCKSSQNSNVKGKENQNNEVEDEEDDIWKEFDLEVETLSPKETISKEVYYDESEKLQCPSNGVMDLGPCKFGAPLYVSWPMFYKSNDSALFTAVDGLVEPNELEHGFRMDIQPAMGIGMAANVRLQMNLRIEGSPVLTDLPKSFESFLLPIMWFDDAIESIPDNIMAMLNEALSAGPGMAWKLFLIFTILSAVEIIIFVAYIVWRYSTTKTTCSTQTSLWWKKLLRNVCDLQRSSA